MIANIKPPEDPLELDRVEQISPSDGRLHCHQSSALHQQLPAGYQMFLLLDLPVEKVTIQAKNVDRKF